MPYCFHETEREPKTVSLLWVPTFLGIRQAFTTRWRRALLLMFELTAFNRKPTDRFVQAANEFLTELIQRVDEAHISSFSSGQAALWWADKRSLGYVQRMLSRLGKRGLLSASTTPRWLIKRSKVTGRAYRRGVMNVYKITLRGRERAAWWVQTQSFTLIRYLASNPAPGQELAQAVALKPLEELRPLFSAGPGLLSFGSRDRNRIGLLLYALSGKSAYLGSFPGIDSTWWLVKVLKREGVIPAELSSSQWVMACRKMFGASVEQVIIATLYKAALYWKKAAVRFENEVRESVNESMNRMFRRMELQEIHNELARLVRERELDQEMVRREILQQLRYEYEQMSMPRPTSTTCDGIPRRVSNYNAHS